MLLEFCLVIIVVIAFLFYPYFNSDNATATTKTHSNATYSKIEELRNIVNIVVNHVQLERAFNLLGEMSAKTRKRPLLLPSYEIYPSESITRTEDGYRIYLVLWNGTQLYDDNTLIYAILHEIAHIMAPAWATHGDVEFEEIEHLLLETAHRLGYYDPDVSLPETYPCILE